jgi:hypothetical protein
LYGDPYGWTSINIDKVLDLVEEILDTYKDVKEDYDEIMEDVDDVKFLEDVAKMLEHPDDLGLQAEVAEKWGGEAMKEALKEVMGDAAGPFIKGLEIGMELGATFGEELSVQLEKVSDNKKCSACAAGASPKGGDQPSDTPYEVEFFGDNKVTCYSTGGSACDSCGGERIFFRRPKKVLLFFDGGHEWVECECTASVDAAYEIGDGKASI